MDVEKGWHTKITMWQWLALLVAAAVVVSAVTYYALPISDSENNDVASDQAAPIENEQQETTDVGTPEATTSDKPGVSVKAPVVSSKLTYEQAIAVSEYRFQFDNNCNGSTGITSGGALNVKQGANIMLENHGDASHVIALGNDAHTIAAGGFVVTKAPKVTKTTGLYITCDGGGAGNLFVNP
ncbi:MAG: hypothetical protein WC052_04140 [Patescibacteria group bacterium]